MIVYKFLFFQKKKKTILFLNIFISSFLTPFIPIHTRSAHPYKNVCSVWAVLTQRSCASLTFDIFLGRLRPSNWNFENSALSAHIGVIVKLTAWKWKNSALCSLYLILDWNKLLTSNLAKRYLVVIETWWQNFFSKNGSHSSMTS